MTLRESLNYEPKVLKFGTSGRRGEVVDLTQLEIYINALAELEYLLSLPRDRGGITRGDEFLFAYDLRPSSTETVKDHGERGAIAQAIVQAIEDAGMEPANLGRVPTPALAYFAMARRKGSIMVTGSHIPFDRNGYKTNSACGELLKEDEEPINERVEQVRDRIYSQDAGESKFEAGGQLKRQSRLPDERKEARDAYVRRYTDFLPGAALLGMKLVVYQHSAVGRDLLVELLVRLGATVYPAGRSDTFVPIDTEAIGAPELKTIQQLASSTWKQHGRFDAVLSTDGDSDRPLVLGVEPDGESCRVRFFGGDLVGMIVARYLGADAVVVPISCNDAVDRGALKDKLQPKTRIGSPYVIVGMDRAREQGKKTVCGWEANGGFLTGSDITRDGRTLTALPTRDAVLPILCVLSAAAEQHVGIGQLFAQLPARYSKASLLRKFPRATSLKIVAMFSPTYAAVCEAVFAGDAVKLHGEGGEELPGSPGEVAQLKGIRDRLSEYFTPADGFGQIQRLNYIDGVRIYFSNGDIAHIRPSGNADELRIYAVADAPERAMDIAAKGVAEPNGILRKLAAAAG